MCNHIINLESVIMMCNCDIKFSTKLCQMKCPKHTHHIQTSVDDFSNLFFSKPLSVYCTLCFFFNTFYVICK